MKVLRLLVATAALFSTTTRGEEEDEEGEVAGKPSTLTFELEHSFGGSEWSPRGSVVVRPSAPRSKMATVANAPSLKEDEAAALWSLCFEQKGYYRLRVKGTRVSTSVPACDLFAIRFRESLELQLSATARLLSLSYRNLPSVTATAVAKPTEIQFETTAAVASDVIGQIVPVQIQASGAKPPPGIDDLSTEEPVIGADGKVQPKKEEPKGFFAKYWHVIVPVVLIFLTAKGEPPAPDNKDGSSSGAAAPAAPAAAAAA